MWAERTAHHEEGIVTVIEFRSTRIFCVEGTRGVGGGHDGRRDKEGVTP